MARIVCSVRTLESLIRQPRGIDIPCCIRDAPRQNFNRSARTFSSRTRLSFDRTSTTHNDAVTHVTSDSAADNHVPSTGGDSQDSPVDLKTEHVVEAWPLSHHSSTVVSSLKGADLAGDVDTSSLVVNGKDLGEHDPVEDGAPDGERKHTLHQSGQKKGLVKDTDSTRTVVTPQPGTRVASRKARKVRRLEAKLGAAKAETSEDVTKTIKSFEKKLLYARQSLGVSAEAVTVVKDVGTVAENVGTVAEDEEARQVKAILESVDNPKIKPKKSALREVKVAKGEETQSATKRKPQQSVKVTVGRKQPASSATSAPISRTEEVPEEPWRTQKSALEKKFGEQGWQPRKRISPDAIAGVRSLHADDPATYSTEKIAEYFQISPEAVRRILKSKWQPNESEAAERRARWERRGERKWTEMVEQGVRPPKKWRDMGVGRAPKGEVPLWKKGARKGVAGERWIEHRPAEALFARAAMTSASSRSQRLDLTDRIL